MQLIRNIDISKKEKNIHLGPVPGGTFWSLSSVVSLPASARQANADAGHLIKNGDLYIQNFRNPGSWEIVENIEDLKKFQIVEQGYDVYVTPYLPELYFVPKNWRGNRTVKKAHYKAETQSLSK